MTLQLKFWVEGLGRRVAIREVAARRDEKRKTFVATVRREDIVHHNVNVGFLVSAFLYTKRVY